MQATSEELITNEELKAKVTAEVMAELEKAGATIIKSYYNGFEELSKALNKFDNYMNKYNEEVKRIRQRYSAEVALQKIHELDLDLAGEKSSICLDLSLIVDKEKKYKTKNCTEIFRCSFNFAKKKSRFKKRLSDVYSAFASLLERKQRVQA